MKRFNLKKTIITIVVFVATIAVLAIVDGKAEKELMGTWAYAYTTEYAEDLDVELTEYFEVTEGRYRWYMDREETKASLLKAYDEYFKSEEINEEDIIKSGYKSIEDCKAQWLEEDLKNIVDDYNEDPGAGTWQINQGTFLFIEDGTSREYKTEYRIEDDTLYLQTDGLILTKVK